MRQISKNTPHIRDTKLKLRDIITFKTVHFATSLEKWRCTEHVWFEYEYE
jgi:hypothetical protein